MDRHPHHAQGRASAVTENRSGRPDYDLIAHLRTIRKDGHEAMFATDQGRLPVTDAETGQLVGLVTRKDLLQVRAGVRRDEAQKRAYILASRPR